MTIGEHLLQVADAGLALGTMHFDEDFFTHLTVLMAIEETLDQGRIALALSDSGTEHGASINTKLDELRSQIRKLIDQCDSREFQTFMEQRAKRLQHQFSGHN